MKQFFLLVLTVLLLQLAWSQDRKTGLQLRSGPVAEKSNLQAVKLSDDTRRKIQFNRKNYVLLRFSQLPVSATKKDLANNGIRLFDFIPGNAYFAEIPADLDLSALTKFSVSGIFLPDASVKINPELERNSLLADQAIAVHFIGNISHETVVKELLQTGAQLQNHPFLPNNTIFIKGDTSVIRKVAALPFVTYLHAQMLKDQQLNYLSRSSNNISSLADPTGRNLTGRGVVMGNGDNGDPTHVDITGRLLNFNPAFAAAHGTHTLGTMASGGILNPKHMGMAPKATAIAQYFSEILVNTPQWINEYGMVLTNNSYHSSAPGCDGTGEYDAISNFVDAQQLNYPNLLHVFAAGNDGKITCGAFPTSYATVRSGFQSSKNSLIVGSYNNSIDELADKSSRGPVKDGRLKPEIVAGGEFVLSSTVNNGYGIISGTSMAAPAVTGSLALLYEKYRLQNGGANPSAALMKALICNGADDMGNPGPDYLWGFGKLNARNAVEMLEQQQYFTGSVTNGNNSTHTILNIPPGTVQLKVMLYWVDPPASPAATTALINNLDLTVTGTDALIHRPLVPDPAPAKVADFATEKIDNLNNIEQVVINTPPAGNFSIIVNGSNVPVGPQQYVVVYQVVQPVIHVDYPAGSETIVPGETEQIRWSAQDASSNNFTIEYSPDNGNSWAVIDNNVPTNTRYYNWTVPVAAARQAKIRVKRNSTSVESTSTNPFVVLGQPMISITNPCPGYAQLSWSPVADADNYEILQLTGDSMKVIASTNSSTWLVGALNKDSLYWFSVRGLINGKAGRRSVAAAVTPSAGNCTDAMFNNDLVVESITRPTYGYLNTPSQLGLETITVAVRNKGTVPTSGNYQLSYQVNNSAVVTESSSLVINANSTVNYTFTAQPDLSALGIHNIKVWVTYNTDPLHSNDTAKHQAKQLDNQPIVLSPSFTEGFESTAIATYSARTIGFDGLDRAIFNCNTTNGRIRTGVTGFARTGNRALLMDQIRFLNTSNTDSVTLTFNLGAYSSTDQIWLDFFYKNQGIDRILPNNGVWIRGSLTGAWVPVFFYPYLLNDIGFFKASPPINITEILSKASPSQTVSSAFQVRFGQQGFTSSNTPNPQTPIDDGITIDDVTFTLPSNNVGIRALKNPVLQGVCQFTTPVPLTVEIKNYSTATLTNIEVGYDLNGNVVKEFVSLNAGELKQHSFAAGVDFTEHKKYNLRVWVHSVTDTYPNNDSLPLVSFNTTPVISTFPYLEDFESDNGKWYTDGFISSWQWGSPNKSVINKAASSNSAWLTGLTDNYKDGEYSYLYSPCFNLSSLTAPVISFSHIAHTDASCVCDIHWVEYSTNDVTWVKLGVMNTGTNWYNHSSAIWFGLLPYWQVSSQNIPINSSRVRFRIAFRVNESLNMEGIGIDDVHIFDSAPVYTGADISAGISQPVSGNGWTNFKASNNMIVAIDPQGQDLGNTTVKVFRNTGAVRNSSNQYYLDRNIVINPATPPSGNVKVRFYFTDAEMDNLFAANNCSTCTKPVDPYRIGITQYSGAIAEENGQLSDNQTGIYQFIPPSQVKVVPYENGYYAEFTVNHFSEFWINGGGPAQNEPLPVTLTQFTATRQNSTAVLQWQTTQELNSKQFTIEKSTDGVLYIPIGIVAAAGNSETIKNYQFIDNMLSNGTNHYRLLITDIDGKSERSPIRTIHSTDASFNLQVFPNPVVNGTLYIRSGADISNIVLTDLSGRTLIQRNTSGTQYRLSLQGIAKGTYLLSVFTNGRKEVQRIVIGE